MTTSATDLDAFGLLGQALGIFTVAGSPNAAWFVDPLGGSNDNPVGLRTVMSDTGQRDALVAFVDDVLGAPDRATRDGATWVPVFVETTPDVVVSAVVEPVGDVVRVGVGVEHATAGDLPRVTTSLHVPIFRFGPAPADGTGPPWLALGRSDGQIELTVDVTLTDGPPPPGEAGIGGLAVTALIPTSAEGTVGLTVTLRDVRLAGAAAPTSFSLDASSLDELGSETLELLLALLDAQAAALDLTSAAARPFAALTGLLGLRAVPNMPRLDLAALADAGLGAIVTWLDGVLGDGTARDAWLGELADLVGATVDAARDAVTIAVGDLDLTIGVRVAPDATGQLTLVPWVDVSYRTGTGASVHVAADVLRAELGTGAVAALPSLRAEAWFGADAGGGDLVTGSPRIGSLHIGVALDPARRPVLALTLHDVTVTGRTYPLLDVSSPEAALDAAADVVGDALRDALDGLGPAGALVAQLVGLEPPTGVAALDAAALLGDPLGALAGYWAALVASPSLAEVVAAVRELLTGVTGAVPGGGTAADPWRIAIVAGADVVVHADGGVLVVGAQVARTQPALGGELTVVGAVELARIEVLVPRVSFASAAAASLALRGPGGGALGLHVGDVSVDASALVALASWSPTRGLAFDVDAPDLALTLHRPIVGPTTIAIPLPRRVDGVLRFDAPDWDAIEGALAALLGDLDLPIVDAALDLLGWSGSGAARLPLGGIVGLDPAAAVAAWLPGAVLDCARLRAVMAPVAAILSGFQVRQAFGNGSDEVPLFAPIAGEPRAPGVAAWLEPGCLPVPASTATAEQVLLGGPAGPDTIVHGLALAATALPDLADLLVARPGLPSGLRGLVERWRGTDGVIGAPASLPDGVASHVVAGFTYDELVAYGNLGLLVDDVLETEPGAVVHVGCEPTMLADRTTNTFDLTGDAPAGTLPATGDGAWHVLLPTPAVAAAARPDRGAVGEQASRLVALLAPRTDPLVVVAYGAAGAAALRAAADVAAVTDVLTVGTPWTALAVEGLRCDALRFLAALEPDPFEPWTEELLALEATPAVQARVLIARTDPLARAADPSALLPPAHTEVRRAGLTVSAVFGAVDEPTVWAGLAAVAYEAVVARRLAAGAIEEPAHDSLHVGVHLPVVQLDIGGLTIGAGATLELAQLERAATVTGLEASARRRLVVDVRFGVTDGWLLGGPTAPGGELEVRWLSARVGLPLGPAGPDDDAATAEVELHDATSFAVRRERWTLTAGGDGVTVTTTVPEARLLLGGVVTRLQAEVPAVAGILEALGLILDGGFDGDALDRLLHDPAPTVHTALATGAPALAGHLRALVTGATGAGGSLAWTVGAVTLGVDLAAGTLTVTAAAPPTTGPPVAVELSAGPAGALLDVSVGALDPDAGGLALAAHVAPGTSPSLTLDWQAPGAAAPRHLALLPAPDAAGLVALATALLPSVAGRALVETCRSTAAAAGRAAIDALLDALGLLGPLDGAARVCRLPLGFVDDPGAWLRRAVAAWRADPTGSAADLLDALAPLVASGGLAGNAWPLAPGVTLTRAIVAGNLQASVAVDHTVTLPSAGGDSVVHLALDAGLAVGAAGPPAPLLTLTVLIGSTGLRVTLTPSLHVELVRAAPAAPLVLHPGGPGLGALVSTVGGMVLPLVLNELIDRRDDTPASLPTRVGQATFDVTGALDLLDAGHVTDARLQSFAADPVGRFATRLPSLVASAVAALAEALDPLATIVRVVETTPARVTLAIGSVVTIAVDGTLPDPAIVVTAHVDVDTIGAVDITELRLAATGVRIRARIGPASVDIGGVELRPVLDVHAGVATTGFSRLVGLGLVVADAPDRLESVQVRWALDAQPPALGLVVDTPTGQTFDTTLDLVATRLLALATTLAAGIALPSLDTLLDTPVSGVAPGNLLQGVLFTDVAASRALDPAFIADLAVPDALVRRLQRLGWNLATSPVVLTIDDAVEVALVSEPAGGARRRIGVRASLAAGHTRVPLVEGDLTVELEIDASWVEPAPTGAGLTIWLFTGALPVGGSPSLVFDPGVVANGIGLRFLKTSGPLLDLGGLALDAIGLSLYGEASGTGLGGGVQLRLEGLAIVPSGAGGTNAVANSIMSDASAAGRANRPVLAPSVAVQKHPGQALAFSVRAGPPPGPWWVLVQRQLGPLYVERVGLDAADLDGRLVRITLLFDGSVSLFGLTASVDQLSISWLGGDVFDIGQWAVDLAGLAISADLSGVSLTGGLLKSTQDGAVSYVGMLMGRFGIYGLSVFGGYTDDDGSPSFFVFGAVNGPIGGPPAFFVTGIGGGLGINRALRVPDDLSQFGDYPFIQALDPAAQPPADPMAELRSLNLYFPPESGTFWFAAGISFNSFALVDGVAVVAVAFGNGLEISLLGLARMALPRPEAALVSIELGLVARFSTEEGVFSIQAQLTDNSWLLYPEVRLTGGFAFALWWKGPLAGQFVLTLGGYHPDFHRDGYPEVPRLGLTWQVTSDISVKGGSYFALTSEALMAGVDVELNADFGWAWARVAFGAHGIVFFDPFWFEVSAYAEISAGVKIKTWFGTISFGISIGASITVWGPEFSGKATFKVGPCRLTVGFGSDRAVEAAIVSWDEFTAKYLEDAGGAARALSSITGRGTLPASTGGAVGAPTSDGSVARPFEVFAEFEITFVTSIPTSIVDLALVGGPIAVPVVRSDAAAMTLGLAPMGASNLASELELRLFAVNASTGALTLRNDLLALLATNVTVGALTETGASIFTDAFPIGAWGAPQSAGALPKGDVVFAGRGVRLVAAASMPPPTVEIDYYQVDKGFRPLPLQATATGRTVLLNTAADYVRSPETTGAALRLAERELFAASTTAAGALDSGARSNLSRVAFARERSAPPLFGTLAEGIVRANGRSVRGRTQPPKPSVVHPGARLPVVEALFAAGTGVAARGATTTVSDAPSVVRRPAPSLASARARLTEDLPIRLVVGAAPAVSVRGGAFAAHVPFTASSGSTRSYVPGRDGRRLDSLVDGLGPAPRPTGAVGRPIVRMARARRAPAPVAHDGVRPGEVVVLRQRDAAIDVSGRRPRLVLDGLARVALLTAEGRAVVDAMTKGSVVVPPGVALVAVHAGVGASDGLAGWHVTSRVASIGDGAALAAGCVIAAPAPGIGRPTGWARAGDVVRGAAAITTTFASPVRTVAIALSGADAQRLTELSLEVIGGAVVAGRDGSPAKPHLVMVGALAVLVYRVEPDGTGPMAVRVRSGGAWELAGVLGGEGSADALVETLASRGPARAVARLVNRERSGVVHLAWKAPAGTVNRRGRNGRR